MAARAANSVPRAANAHERARACAPHAHHTPKTRTALLGTNAVPLNDGEHSVGARPVTRTSVRMRLYWPLPASWSHAPPFLAILAGHAALELSRSRLAAAPLAAAASSDRSRRTTRAYTRASLQ